VLDNHINILHVFREAGPWQALRGIKHKGCTEIAGVDNDGTGSG